MSEGRWKKISAIALSIFVFDFAYSQIDSLINKDSIRAVVAFLASDSLQGRLTGSAGALTAANFIQQEFKKAGLRAFDSTRGYFYPFKTQNDKVEGYNVMGILPGTDPSSGLVIFSAHYDHIGTISTNPNLSSNRRKYHDGEDTIFNGANDNASGTAALISLARYYGSVKNNKRSILFVAFSGEELGLVGSYAIASSIANPSSVVCMINLEMLGRGSAPFITGSQLGNLRPILNRELYTVGGKQFGKHYFSPEIARDQKLFTRSDNYPFALMRIPAYTIMTTTDTDQYYHTVDDEVQTLDYEKIERVTRVIALAMEGLINRRVAPWRINVDEYAY
jgi:Zn-dependent M28 family amino/carboxypeptidase